jgi:hypothetical protein
MATIFIGSSPFDIDMGNTLLEGDLWTYTPRFTKSKSSPWINLPPPQKANKENPYPSTTGPNRKLQIAYKERIKIKGYTSTIEPTDSTPTTTRWHEASKWR